MDWRLAIMGAGFGLTVGIQTAAIAYFMGKLAQRVNELEGTVKNGINDRLDRGNHLMQQHGEQLARLGAQQAEVARLVEQTARLNERQSEAIGGLETAIARQVAKCEEIQKAKK